MGEGDKKSHLFAVIILARLENSSDRANFLSRISTARENRNFKTRIKIFCVIFFSSFFSLEKS